MQALAAAPFGRRPGLERAPAAAPESKTPRVGPWWPWVVPRPRWGRVRLKSPPVLQLATCPPHSVLLAPDPSVAAHSPSSVRRTPSTSREKVWRAVASPCLPHVVTLAVSLAPLPAVGPDPTPLLGRLPALLTRPLFVHRCLQRSPSPAALPAQHTRSCFVLCPLAALFPFFFFFFFFIFFWFHLFESENQPLFLATCLAKICVAARSRRKGFPPRSFPRHRNVRTA